jgi:hypothetical protein
MLDVGEPIVDTIPNVVTEETAKPGEPGFGWTLSEDALREIALIDENRMLAAARAATIHLD